MVTALVPGSKQSEGPEKFPHPESRALISVKPYDYRAVLFTYS